jgi:zinc protease
MISKKIKESMLPSGGTLLLLSNDVKDIISIQGSFLGGHVFAPSANSEIPEVTVSMLDQGTKNRTKQEIEDFLESIGASISFRSSPFRIYFSISCLRVNLEQVLEVFVDELYNPTFLEYELNILKKRFVSMIRENKENTRSEANRALSTILFPKNHPYYSVSTDEEISLIQSITTNDLVMYHKSSFDFSSMNISIVGDLPNNTVTLFEKYLNIKSFDIKIKKKLLVPLIASPAKIKGHKKKLVYIGGKANADLLVGHSLAIRQNHPDLMALYVAIQVFGGGGFTSRLMHEVREKRGLTYGVNASLQGVSEFSDCYVAVWGTFAPTTVEQGKSVILAEYQKLVTRGVNAVELAEIKRELVGSYRVSLETTSRLASLLLTNKEAHRSNDYIDTYVDVIDGVTLAHINAVIKKYLDTENIAIVVAGTVTKSTRA